MRVRGATTQRKRHRALQPPLACFIYTRIGSRNAVCGMPYLRGRIAKPRSSLEGARRFDVVSERSPRASAALMRSRPRRLQRRSLLGVRQRASPVACSRVRVGSRRVRRRRRVSSRARGAHCARVGRHGSCVIARRERGVAGSERVASRSFLARSALGFSQGQLSLRGRGRCGSRRRPRLAVRHHRHAAHHAPLRQLAPARLAVHRDRSRAPGPAAAAARRAKRLVVRRARLGVCAAARQHTATRQRPARYTPPRGRRVPESVAYAACSVANRSHVPPCVAAPHQRRHHVRSMRSGSAAQRAPGRGVPPAPRACTPAAQPPAPRRPASPARRTRWPPSGN